MKLLMLDGKPPVFKKDLFTAAEGFWSEKMHALPGVHVIRAVCLIGELPSRSRAVADLEVTLVAGETYTFDCTPPDKYDSIKMYMTDSAGNDIRYRFIRSIPPNGQ
ncbi:hypothetical protein [Pseudomonas sp. CGJS7]|uniref:hypothetical protein n=1 Tax=Pseudomonas sp. CGJS7 TaxID=3109348 RepID=UPI00300AE53B